MGILGNQSGVSTMKVMIVLAVLVVGFIQGIKYLTVQLDYQRMRDTMEAKANAAQVLKDEEILNDLVIRSMELGLPMVKEHFTLTRDDYQGVVTIQTAWDVPVRYLWGLCGEPCDQTYHFAPIVQASLRK